jgi:hypothetical protein
MNALQVRLGKIQRPDGAACVKLSGTSDVIVDSVFCEGHSNTLTIDYSQYTDHPHAEIIVSNLIGVDPVSAYKLLPACCDVISDRF